MLKNLMLMDDGAISNISLQYLLSEVPILTKDGGDDIDESEGQGVIFVIDLLKQMIKGFSSELNGNEIIL